MQACALDGGDQLVGQVRQRDEVGENVRANDDQVDPQLVVDNAEIIADTRNVFSDISGKAKIFKA